MEKRIRWVIFLYFFGFSLVLLKLFYWQILKSSQLKTLAVNQYSSSIEIPASRGKIYSSDKFPLVLNKTFYNLFLEKRNIKITLSELEKKIISFFPAEEQRVIKERMAQIKDKEKWEWTYLIKDVNEEIKENLSNLKIEGLGFEEIEKRFYPEDSLLAHVLGFVGEGENGKIGYYGLEGYYDKELKGKPGFRLFEKDALGEKIPLKNEVTLVPIPGRDLVLNIVRPLQFIVEKHLAEGIKKYSASSGWVVILDVNNGHLLASASYPSYSPQKYNNYSHEVFLDPVISSSFEPGSIFKIIVMAAALDAGVIKSTDICTECSGPKVIGEYTIKTWNDKYYPNSSMTDIIVHSDNVGMVFVGEKIGASRLYNYLKKFGFGEKTGIDLQGEISPLLRNPEEWKKIDLATISFGQGIAVTPIQVLTAVASIANGGILYRPQVVNKIIEGDNEMFVRPEIRNKTISPKTAAIIKNMMIEAVERGEARWAKPNNLSIAGKTGTAQIPIQGHYDPEKTIASFIGFAPAEKPVFAMLVSLKEPKTSPWGSETAAPLWFEIAKDVYKLLKINKE